jgi:hypothetical protein
MHQLANIRKIFSELACKFVGGNIFDSQKTGVCQIIRGANDRVLHGRAV